jgi:ribosomal protein S18 acetylase RimI-like enzyme
MIREIEHNSSEYWATVELRDSVLRKPLGLTLSPEELEAERDSHHLAFFQGNHLAGCLVLRPAGNGDIQMRQVAVAPDLRGHGIGKALVNRSEELALELGYRRMILHAREPAVPFYERLGYRKTGDRFEEVTIPHWSMEKWLILNLVRQKPA